MNDEIQSSLYLQISFDFEVHKINQICFNVILNLVQTRLQNCYLKIMCCRTHIHVYPILNSLGNSSFSSYFPLKISIWL